MKFIKLAGPIYIKAKSIQSVEWSESLNLTVIGCKNCNSFEVEEKPEEVMNLIWEKTGQWSKS